MYFWLWRLKIGTSYLKTINGWLTFDSTYLSTPIGDVVSFSTYKHGKWSRNVEFFIFRNIIWVKMEQLFLKSAISVRVNEKSRRFRRCYTLNFWTSGWINMQSIQGSQVRRYNKMFIMNSIWYYKWSKIKIGLIVILNIHFRIVLSACSTYLRTVLKDLPRWQHPVIMMPKDLPSRDLEDILTFIYWGKVHVDKDRLSSFLRVGLLSRFPYNWLQHIINDFRVNGRLICWFSLCSQRTFCKSRVWRRLLLQQTLLPPSKLIYVQMRTSGRHLTIIKSMETFRIITTGVIQIKQLTIKGRQSDRRQLSFKQITNLKGTLNRLQVLESLNLKEASLVTYQLQQSQAVLYLINQPTEFQTLIEEIC